MKRSFPLHHLSAPALRSLEVAALLLFALHPPLARAADLQPVNVVIGHPVASADGRFGGNISDVLVDLPSGRVLYVATEPNELFQRSKVVPLTAIERTPSGPWHVRVSFDDWVQLPQIDRLGWTIMRFTDRGTRYVACMEPAWWHRPGTPVDTLQTIAAGPGHPPLPRFVSLHELLGTGVSNGRNEQLGSIDGYLLDWRQQRVAFALLARPGSGDTRFAVAIETLMPPAPQGETLVASASLDDLRQAPVVRSNQLASANVPGRVFRFESAGAVAANRR